MVLTSLWWGTTERLCFRDGTAIEANTAHYNIKEAKIQPFTARHKGGGSLVCGPFCPRSHRCCASTLAIRNARQPSSAFCCALGGWWLGRCGVAGAPVAHLEGGQGPNAVSYTHLTLPTIFDV